MENLTNENFEEKVKSGKVLVDFFAVWCGPCKMISPMLEELKNENPDTEVYKVDVDEQPELAAKFGIRGVPTIYFFKNGEIIEKSVGAQTKTYFQNMISK